MRPVPRSVAGTRAVRPRRSRAHGTEDVLCVPRSTIFPDGAWHGLIARGLERVLRTVHATSEYRPRAEIEDDPELQQIIPYCVVHHPHDDTYLLTRRLRRSSEKRLHHLYSLGIGGHVNPGDGEREDPVVGGLRREWAEEIRCTSPARASLVALLNDDSSPVSRVHLGLVFLVEPEDGGGRGSRGREARGRIAFARGDAAPLPEHGVVVAARLRRPRRRRPDAGREEPAGRRPRTRAVSSTFPARPDSSAPRRNSPRGSPPTLRRRSSGSDSGRRASSARASPTPRRSMRRFARAGSTASSAASTRRATCSVSPPAAPKSNWTDANLRRVDELRAAGRLRAGGERAVAAAISRRGAPEH